VSVAPYAWKKGTLYFCSKARIIPIGAAEPPQSTPRKLEISYVFSSNSFNSPNHIVGTPAVIVTLYFSIKVAKRFGVKRGPGITCVEPNHVQAKCIPHALTCNCGTTGIATSDSETAAVSAKPNA